MVKGDPDQRRRYLDDLLVATRPRFAGVRADYERVLRQRTALLKSARAMAASGAGARGSAPRGSVPRGSVPSALEVWDDHLIATGAELTAGRLELTVGLRPLMAKAYAAVSGEDLGAGMSYRQAGADPGGHNAPRGQPGPRWPGTPRGASQEDAEPPADREVLADGLRQALARARRAELERGVCLVGPHRDELELRVGELPARGYASQGESWSLALALRIAAYDLLRSGGEDPVLILDDRLCRARQRAAGAAGRPGLRRGAGPGYRRGARRRARRARRPEVRGIGRGRSAVPDDHVPERADRLRLAREALDRAKADALAKGNRPGPR